MADSVHVFAPATVGNACVGFDVLGFAVKSPGDEVFLRKSDSKGVIIKEITGDGGRLSSNPEENTASIPILAFLDEIDSTCGVEMILHKKMPFGSGLGSSAASAVAGSYAVNELFGKPFAKEKVLEFAMEGEFFASGAHHADNVAPCLYGGVTLIRSNDPYDVISIGFPEDLFVVLIYPEVEIKTAEARTLLPYNIPMKTASKQWANVGGLITGLMTSDYQLISRSMVDYVAEPYRSKLIPGFDEVKDIAKKTGALGLSISGSGPAMFAFCQGEVVANSVAAHLSSYYKKKEMNHQLFVSSINKTGPVLLD